MANSNQTNSSSLKASSDPTANITRKPNEREKYL
jgi:hypothetical protein